MNFSAPGVSVQTQHLLHRMVMKARDRRNVSPAHELEYQLRKRQFLCAAYGGSLRQLHLMAIRAKNAART